MWNILKQKIYGLSGGGSIGVNRIDRCRPLLVSGPVKPKRPMAATSSVTHSEYACARYMRKKLLLNHNKTSGKQEILAFDSRLYGPVAFASHIENERIALQARVLPEQLPAPDLPNCLAWISANMSELLPRIHKVVSVPFERYLERVGSSPSVKKRLRETYERLKLEGVTSESTLTASQVKMFVKRSSFVKVENLLYHSPAGLKNKSPRLIQGATPEFVVLVGPWIMALQDLVCRRWRPGKSPFVFTSGISAEQAAEHVTGIPGHSGFDDVATFDLDQTRPWGRFFVKWCKTWGAPTATLQLLRQNIDTVGSTHHGFKYKCEGTRKSGDPYTSLFNTMINIFAHAYIYCRHFGVTVRQCADTLRMLAQGDDNFFTHSQEPTVPWRAAMLALGFDSEATYGELERLEFCSMRLYKTPEGWTFGPMPGRVITKFGYAVNRPDHVAANEYLRGVAKSQATTSSFIPILKTFYDRVLELTKDAEGKEFTPTDFDKHQLKIRRAHTASPDVMYALNTNYYWCYERQRKFEEEMATKVFGERFSSTVENLLMDRDTAGIPVMYAGA